MATNTTTSSIRRTFGRHNMTRLYLEYVRNPDIALPPFKPVLYRTIACGGPNDTETMSINNKSLHEAKNKMVMNVLKIYKYDSSSLKLTNVEIEHYNSEDEAKKGALSHNWNIAYENCDTDLSQEEYIEQFSWDDLEDISYETYGYEIEEVVIK